MTVFKYTFVFGLAVGGLALTAQARTNIGDRSDRDIGSRTHIAKEFSANGILQCDGNGHLTGEECDMKFVRLSDKETFDVEANKELLARHCDDHQDARIHISGKYTLRTIFGNDRIKVEKFDSVTKLEPGEVTELLGMNQVKQTRHPRLYDSGRDI